MKTNDLQERRHNFVLQTLTSGDTFCQRALNAQETHQLLEGRLLSETVDLVDLDMALTENLVSGTTIGKVASPSSAWAYVRFDGDCRTIRVLINQPVTIEIKGAVDEQRLRALMDELRAAHPDRSPFIAVGKQSPAVSTVALDWFSFTQLLPRLAGFHFIQHHARVVGLSLSRIHDIVTRLGRRVTVLKIAGGSAGDDFILASAPQGLSPLSHQNPQHSTLSLFFDFVLSVDGLQITVVQISINDVVNVEHCYVGGLVQSQSRAKFIEPRLGDLRSAILRTVATRETSHHRVSVSVCNSICDILQLLKNQHKSVSRLTLNKPSIFIVGVSDSLLPLVRHELLYPEAARIEVRHSTVLFSVSNAIFREEGNALISESVLWKFLCSKVCSIILSARKSLVHAASLDVPIGTAIRVACQAETASQIWDLYFGRLLRKTGMASGSTADSFPGFSGFVSTADIVLERDQFEVLDGGPCHDGTQELDEIRDFHHYSRINPRFVRPGLYRNQIVHIKFSRPIALQVLGRFDLLAEYFEIPTDGNFYDIKPNQEKRKKQIYFVQGFKHSNGDKVTLEKSDLFIDPIIKQFLALCKVFKANKFLLNDRTIPLWFIDTKSPFYNPYRTQYMWQKLVPLMYKVIIESISVINKKIGLEILPLAIWDTGLLLQFPTTQPTKARAASQIVLQHLASQPILDGFFDLESTQQYRHGIQIDYRNNIFLNNEDELEHISFPYLDTLPPTLASLIEE
eukprot:Gregarina_sp_Poly_1__8840@NODE_531_length_7661_cov_51_609033_g421_i0_p1_GENE_NODE_531_length_7661_cov_51_609033_g421_i0NODE_531_length_7661_cov_51_609033_g421_i0_p1_ORF_typecomplete_len740_score111_70DUF1744/PF08490_12/1_6e06_NODE_531_length_7661_cov_51_609033_g421_i014253644